MYRRELKTPRANSEKPSKTLETLKTDSEMAAEGSPPRAVRTARNRCARLTRDGRLARMTRGGALSVAGYQVNELMSQHNRACCGAGRGPLTMDRGFRRYRCGRSRFGSCYNSAG